MRDAPAWFSRSFDVPYPADLLPQLLARLRGTPARVEELARDNSLAELSARIDDKWSAQENAGHMLDLEPLWLARVDDYVTRSSKLTAADLTNQKTNDANHNTNTIGQILAHFRAARETLMKRVDGADASHFTLAIPHPRLGIPMTLSDHLHFVAEHDDHHLARMWNLLNVRP